MLSSNVPGYWDWGSGSDSSSRSRRRKGKKHKKKRALVTPHIVDGQIINKTLLHSKKPEEDNCYWMEGEIDYRLSDLGKRKVTLFADEDVEDVITQKRKLKHENLIDGFSHFKPQPNWTILVNEPFTGRLPHYLEVNTDDLVFLDFIGDAKLTDINWQVLDGLNSIHNAGFYYEHLSWETLFYVDMGKNPPVVKFDRTLMKKSVNIQESKTNNWRELGQMYSDLNSGRLIRRPFSCSYEYQHLADLLKDKPIDLDTVVQVIRGHPAFWCERRILFLLEFLEKLKPAKHTAVMNAIEAKRDDILPSRDTEPYHESWKSYFKPELMKTMNEKRLDFKVRKALRKANLDTNDEQLFLEEKAHHQNENQYNGNSVYDYICFSRNLIIHLPPSEGAIYFGKSFTLPKAEGVFRELQPHTLMTLKDIADGEGWEFF